MNDLKPNTKRAKNAIVFVWLVMATGMINLIFTTLTFDQMPYVSDFEDNLNDDHFTESIPLLIGQVAISFFYVIIMILSIITFIQWFRRAYYNLHQKVNYLEFSEGWAAGSWFVPILNLFRPFQIMKELYFKTHSLLMNNNQEYTKPLNKNLLGLWWALWIISRILGRISYTVSKVEGDRGDYNTTSILTIIELIILIPLSIVTVKVIKDYARIETLLFESENSSLQSKPFDDSLLDSSFMISQKKL